MSLHDENRIFRPPGDRKTMFGVSPKQNVFLGLFLAGLLIGISFTALLVPLAVYQVAQVAVSLRLRTAFFLLVAVVLSLGLLGVTFSSDILLLGCVWGLVWSPLIFIGLTARCYFRTSKLALLAFLLPSLLLLWSAFLIPQIANLGSFLELQKSEYLSFLQHSSSITDAAMRNKLISNWENTFALIHNLPEFESIARIAAYSTWQRLTWLVYGNGSPFYFGLILVGLSSAALLDFAYDQVEKFKATLLYIAGNRSEFPRQILDGLERIDAFKILLKKTPELPVAVNSHSRNSGARKGNTPSFSDILLNPKSGGEHLSLWGFRFPISRVKKGWNFRNFSLPLWVGFVSIATLFIWVMLFNDAAGILEAATRPYFGPLIAISSVIAFFLVTLLAAQGVLVLYTRLKGAIVLLFLILVLLFGTYLSLNPLLVVAIFGGIGLLDNIYDFRGRKLSKELPKLESL